MTTQRDIERILDTWLRDGPDEVADRVVDAVADRIEHQSQRPAWHLRWRNDHVTTNLKPFAAVAAVLVLAVVGVAAIVGLTSRGGAASPPSRSPSAPAGSPAVSPAASPSASAVASASVAAVACAGGTTGCAGALAAGEHASTNFLLDLTFTTPDGWLNVRDIRRTYGIETNSGLGAAIEVMGLNAIANQGDACGPVAKPGAGSSVQDFITAVQTHPGLVATAPVAAELDGFKGQSIDFTVAATWGKMCPAIEPLYPTVLMLTDTGEPPGRTIGYHSDQRVRWIVLDVRGETIIVELVGPAGESSFTSSVAAAQPIVDSFRFGPAN
jgi:hypothetical protein